MKIISLVCFSIIFQINVSLLFNTEREMKYTNGSYFTAIGITGEGKSSFLNVLSGKNGFSTSSKGNSETQTVQNVSFNFDGTSFVAIDTPGLDDSGNNSQKINDLKKLIFEYPTLKCLLIVKKYNTFRLSLSLQESIKVFIEAFPKTNFWDHVIVINTFANPNDESFKYYFENEKELFLDKILNVVI
jgi:predicted GTPase